MTLKSNMRRWIDDVSWQVRGAFATEANRRVGFWARSLCQPAEVLARKRWAKELESELAPALRVPDADGHMRLPASGIPSVREICDAGRSIAQATLHSSMKAPAGKSFHRNRLAEGENLAALLRVALDRRMIAMAATYLGVVPVLADVDFFMSLSSAKPWSKSQLWHCDDDAPRQLKVFVYCDDVDEENGPFEMISAADSHRVRTAIKYRYAGRRYRVSDELMDEHLPRKNQLSIRGPRESSFVVDTARCFHKGSRIVEPGRWRMVAVMLYCTPNGAKLPLRLASRPGPFATLANEHTGDLERAVLGRPIARSR